MLKQCSDCLEQIRTLQTMVQNNVRPLYLFESRALPFPFRVLRLRASIYLSGRFLVLDPAHSVRRSRRGWEGRSERASSVASGRDRQNTLSPSRPSPSSFPTRGVYAALSGLGSKFLAQLQALPYLIFSVRDELQF